jgi:hypothetical protein
MERWDAFAEGGAVDIFAGKSGTGIALRRDILELLEVKREGVSKEEEVR